MSVQKVPGPALEIVVRDRGAGFDSSRITARGARGGGLGLFGVQERLELMGGQLQIDSAPGQGSAFTLRAPLAAQDTTAVAGATAKPVTPPADKTPAQPSAINQDCS